MNWRQRLGAFIGGFDAGQHHRRLRGFQAPQAHVNALIAASGPDITVRARWLVRNNGYAVNAIRQGIEFDRIGRRLAYHFFRRHPGDSTDPGLSGESPVQHLGLGR